MYPLSMLNIDVLAPMPSPSVMTAMRVKPGERLSDLRAKRRSPRMASPATQLPMRCPVHKPDGSFMAFSSAHREADIVPGSLAGHIPGPGSPWQLPPVRSRHPTVPESGLGGAYEAARARTSRRKVSTSVGVFRMLGAPR